MPSVGLLVLCLTLIVGTQGNTNNIVSKFLETKQSCLEPSQFFSGYCWDIITSDTIDNDTLLTLLCTDCREEFVNFYRVCDSEEVADEIDDGCTTLGYEKPVTDTEKPVTEKPTSGSDDSAPIAAIIGGVLGGFTLILATLLITAAIIAITCCSFKRSKRNEMLAAQAQAPKYPAAATDVLPPPPPMYQQEQDPGAMFYAPPPAPVANHHMQQAYNPQADGYYN